MPQKQNNESAQITFTKSNISGAVKTCTASKTFINISVKACVINILYHRLRIGKDNFIEKFYKDISYKSFKSKSKDPIIRQYHSWMTGFKEAFFKNYLKQFQLFLIDEDTGNIEEYYKFQFKYSDKKNFVPKDSDDLEEKVIDLLKALLELDNYEKLGENVNVKIEFRFNDNTPMSYEPFGFESAPSSLMDSLNEKLRYQSIFNQFSTGYHNFLFHGKTNKEKINSTPELLSIENVDGDQRPFNTSPNHESDDANVGYSIASDPENEKELNEIDEALKDNDIIFKDLEDMHQISESSFDDPTLSETVKSCYCDLVTDSKLIETIKCTKCHNRYHLFCNALLRKEDITEPFVCICCSNDVNDTKFKGIPPEFYAIVSRLRIFLGFIELKSEIPVNIMPDNIFQETMKYVRKLKIIEENPEKGFKIVEENIKPLLEKYFTVKK